jgi:hypothetical protein
MANKSGDESLGTVFSKPFQFAEVEYVRLTETLGRRVWNDSAVPKKLEPIRNRWIYAFEVAQPEELQKRILVAEYHADGAGHLAVLPGAKRRRLDPGQPGTDPLPVPAAALPATVQGRRLAYFFVATRVRLGKTGIAMIENLERESCYFFARRVLAEDHDLHRGAGAHAPWFVRVADPMTTAEALHRAYVQSLNECIRVVCPVGEKDQAEQVAVRTRQYQLGKILRDSFLTPLEGPEDPLGMRKHLEANGRPLFKFLHDYEKRMHELAAKKEECAWALVRFLDSPLWRGFRLWSRSNLSEYHYFLESAVRCIERLRETNAGFGYLRKLVLAEDEDNVANELIAPEPEASEERQKFYEQSYGPVRKTITAVFLGIAEFGPALVVSRKASALSRIQETMVTCLESARATLETGDSAGKATALLGTTRQVAQLKIAKDGVTHDLKKWLEEGKPHWPPGTRFAKVSDVLGKVMWAVESVNFFNVITEFVHKREREWTDIVEVPGAALDLLIAFEDQIREAVHAAPRGAANLGAKVAEAEKLPALGAEAGRGSRIGGEVMEFGEGAEGAEAEEAAHGLAGKLVSPLAFKVLGGISAAIDFAVHAEEWIRAEKRGEIGAAGGHLVAAVGAGMVAVGSAISAWGYYAGAAYTLVFATSLLFVGTLIFAAGLLIVSYFDRSAFQKFARYCIFGEEKGHHGTDNWVTGNFSEWDNTARGLDLQIRHLMALLCDFKVSGTGEDTHKVNVYFGCTPPEAELELEFAIEYENGHVLQPSYSVSLETGAVEGEHMPLSAFHFEKDRFGKPHLLHFGAHRDDLVRGKPVKSTCELRMSYGGRTHQRKAGKSEHSPENGAESRPHAREANHDERTLIPTWGPVAYKIFAHGTPQRDALRSIEAEPEKKRD